VVPDLPVPKHHPIIRRTTRRLADRHLQKRLDRYSRLIQAGQVITSELNFDALFEAISGQIVSILNVERCSIFLIDENEQNLCPFVSADLDADQFQFPKGQGIAGWVFCNKRPQIINNAYKDPRFLKDVDKKTGFRTVNLLCVPLIGHGRGCIGTIQVLNKREGDFTEEDSDILTYIASYVTVALENSSLYEELKATDRVRQKVVNHLAHELKTPLAILTAVMSRFADTAHDRDQIHLVKTIERGQRSIDRLNQIQEKVEDIVGRKRIDHEKQYIHMIEDLISLIEETGEDPAVPWGPLAASVVDRIKSIFGFEEEKIETIRADLFLKRIHHDALETIHERNLDISLEMEENLYIKMDKTILKKICEGLLKNAIENTPDEGRIELTAGSRPAEVFLRFQDHGVGITAENKKNIFKGFFHTQPTQHYSSKTPYAFNAGGTGTDLLRLKTYSERFGFKINFSSRRCRFLPGEGDICPGRMSLCGHIHAASDCMCPGGSTFTVSFPGTGHMTGNPHQAASTPIKEKEMAH
jgi:signal transduction histidine kinase